MKNKPSIYQKIVFNKFRFSKSNLIISAVAGSGKTTTIVECIKFIPKGKDSIFFAFNNHIVRELEEKIKREDVKVSTIHSFCWRALNMHYRGKKLKLNKAKALKYAEALVNKNKIEPKKKGAYIYSLLSLCDLTRQNLVVGDIDEAVRLANHHDIWYDELSMEMLMSLMKMMDSDKAQMDYTDMIYRSIKENVKLPTFDYVFIDESQDLSRMQQEIIRRSKKTRGRMIAVGDEMQSIYGFAGADADSYKKMKTLFPDTQELKLSINYRCGKSIVKKAQEYNPNILPFDKNSEGLVSTSGDLFDINEGDWVICRNLKPLVYMNLFFLSLDKKSYIKGVEIGNNLAAIITRNKSTTCEGVLLNYDDEIKREIAKMRKKGVRNPSNTEKIDRMMQTLEILKVLSFDVSDVKSLLKKIKGIFKEGGQGIMLSTIHKTKGLENDKIFFLCPELIPSKYATKEWELTQEKNLAYVGTTRAKKQLTYIPEIYYKEVEEQFKN